MLFEVVYANGTRNEVDLEGTSIIVGRDPSCDLVLNDVRCSRRHAVIEAGADGLAVLDNGSANGVFVNGKKVERAPLTEGDTIRLGEVVINVLPDEILPTVAMDASDLADVESTEPIERPQMAPPAPPRPPAAPPPQAPPRGIATSRPEVPQRPPTPQPRTVMPAPPPPVRTTAPAPPRRLPSAGPAAGGVQPGTRAPAAGRPAVRRAAPPPVVSALPRPLTVTLLAGLWTLGGVAGGAIGLGYTLFSSAAGAIKIVAALAAGLNAIIGVAVGWGLWTLATWARPTILVLTGLGTLSCIGTLPSLATLVYMLRPETKVIFSGVADLRQLSEAQSQVLNEAPDDLTFSLVLLASLFVTFILGAVLTYLSISYLATAGVG